MKTWCKKVVSALLLVGSFAAATARGALPAGYTELEYIQSTREQVLNFGYKPKENTKYVFDWKLSGAFDCSAPHIFKCVAGDYSFTLNFGGTTESGQENRMYLRPWKTSGVTTCMVTDAIRTARNTMSFGQGMFTWGTVSQEIHANATAAEATFIQDQIFLGSDANTPFKAYTATIYGIQIYEGATLVHDFVPCEEVSSGLGGLYDKLGGAFYSNASASHRCRTAPA